ncbi:MAG: serine/threonine protein kinase [Deltaproteobacteria bacterium]|nr:serine/threonine protein kinase [Deltaproteobacteria bacterium]
MDPASRLPPPDVPEWLGRYEVLKYLASGGMADLFLGRVSGLEGFEKIVVLKRIRSELAADLRVVRLFLNEARLAAKLDHSNIVQVYDVGEEQGQYYYAMEFVPGLDLRAIVKRHARPFPLDVTLAIGVGLCAGLHYAHERVDRDGTPLRLVHCDVSPSNVLVSYDGAVKITDFGIARALRDSPETRQSALCGKFGYMSPEQCLGRPLDQRSDVFALGILLAELSTGRRLFEGPSDYESMKLVVEDPLPYPPLHPTEEQQALVPIVRRALERNRDRRYASAQELERDLEALAQARRLSPTSLTLRSFVEAEFPEEVESYRSASPDGDDLDRHWAQTSTLDLPLQEVLSLGQSKAVSPQSAASSPRRPSGPLTPVARVPLPVSPADSSPAGSSPGDASLEDPDFSTASENSEELSWSPWPPRRKPLALLVALGVGAAGLIGLGTFGLLRLRANAPVASGTWRGEAVADLRSVGASHDAAGVTPDAGGVTPDARAAMPDAGQVAPDAGVADARGAASPAAAEAGVAPEAHVKRRPPRGRPNRGLPRGAARKRGPSPAKKPSWDLESVAPP